MTVIRPGNPVNPKIVELIVCDSCGDVSVNTPMYGWKRYRYRDIDITVCHHCPTCVEYNNLALAGLVYGIAAKDAAVYEDWVAV